MSRKRRRSDDILQAKARKRHEREVKNKEKRLNKIKSRNDFIQARRKDFINSYMEEMTKRFQESFNKSGE